MHRFSDDIRLNQQRTSLLLRYGTAADLFEVHLRLSALEADLGPWDGTMDEAAKTSGDWSDDDLALLQLIRLHRAAYLALVGRTVVAGQLAKHAEGLNAYAAEFAARLAKELNYEPPTGIGSATAMPTTSFAESVPGLQRK